MLPKLTSYARLVGVRSFLMRDLPAVLSRLFWKDRHRQPFRVANECQGTEDAHLRVSQQPMQIVDPGDHLLVQRDDHVSFPNAGGACWAVGLDSHHHDPGFLW